jgi:hypothetical protein
MNIYIDESIHDQHEFMLLGFVICPHDPQPHLERLLNKYKKQEYHSLEKMAGNENAQLLRREIREYVNWNCKWGVCVLPSSLRWNISYHLREFLEALTDTDEQFGRSKVFIDKGIIRPSELVVIHEISNVKEASICESHKTHGIQLADFVAAICGVRLREEISQEPKFLTYGKEAGFEPPIEAELGYELWASLRYSMYKNRSSVSDEEQYLAEFSTKGYGYHISQECPSGLMESADKLFSTVYLGCIH